MKPLVLLALVLAPLAAAAAPPDVVVPEALTSGGFGLERIDVIRQPGPAGPAQVQVSIVLPDACTVVQDVLQRREGSQIRLVVSARRAASRPCERIAVRVLELVPLQGNLEPGSYTVRLEGTEGGFTLGERVALEEDGRSARLLDPAGFRQP